MGMGDDCGVQVKDERDIPETGKPLSTSSAVDWTSVFSEELCAIGAERDDVVAITAAMAGPTGLAAFGERFPERM